MYDSNYKFKAECVNPTNVRRNDSCSSMLSRNSSTSSSVRPSYSNTSTSLHRSTSSVGANNSGRLGSTMSSNNLAPSTGKHLDQIDIDTVTIHNEETFSIQNIYTHTFS